MRYPRPTDLPARVYRDAEHPMGVGSPLIYKGTTHVITPEHVNVMVNNPHAQSSVSAVKNWRECNRLWWFENIKGIKPPRSSEATAGTAMHKELETREIKHASLAMAVNAGLIDFPGEDIDKHVEEEREFWLPLGLRDGTTMYVRGFMDQVVITYARDNRMSAPARKALVLNRDYKTKKDDRAMLAYSLSPEELNDDFQMNTYSMVLLREEGVDAVHGEHVYLSRDEKKPGAMTVPAAVPYTFASVEPHITKMVEDLEVMNQHALLRVIDDVPPNFDHCKAYKRKCAFYAICHGDTSEWEAFPTTEDQPLALINPPDASAAGAQESKMVDINALIAKKAAQGGAAPAKPAPAPAAKPAAPAKPATAAAAVPATKPAPGAAARKLGSNKVTLPDGNEVIISVKAVGAGFHGFNVDNEAQQANGPSPDAVVNAVALQVLNGINAAPAEEPLPDDEVVDAAETPAEEPAQPVATVTELPKRGPGRPRKAAAADTAPATDAPPADAEDARNIRMEVMLTALCKHLGVKI